jgi:hypothetical protein
LSGIRTIFYKDFARSLTIWAENETVVNALNEFCSISVRHKTEGEIPLVQLLSQVLSMNFKGKYEHVIIEDTLNESLSWEYPSSQLILVNLCWFFSLGYCIFKEKNWNTKELDEFAEKFNFKYEVIYE